MCVAGGAEHALAHGVVNGHGVVILSRAHPMSHLVHQ
jgi:hypothetical protein